MPEYAFDQLSPLEFERLTRDLLQAAHGMQLQSFDVGRDGGIDLRQASPTHPHALVVQCKHYAGSSVSQLVSQLRRHELAKVARLAPARYVLVTSLDVSPTVRDEICRLFAPYCATSNDVMTRTELNNLLGQHPEVERRHPKLWLASTAVLERILHAGVFAGSDDELDQIRRTVARSVIHGGVPAALARLDADHLCIITGNPGVGKTTLARLVLAELVANREFELVTLSEGLPELAVRRRRGQRQVFYFDDFLGQTRFEGLHRHEDRRLVELMRDVRAEPNWRLVLTTREYVLERARQLSEPLAAVKLAPHAFTVSPEQYTTQIRAEMLYQHLFWSDLPPAPRLALLQSGQWSAVIQHPNFNPRLLEFLTSSAHAGHIPPAKYVDAFLHALQTPELLWEHAYHEGIDADGRDVLCIAASFAGSVTLTRLEAAWHEFQRSRATLFGASVSARPLRRVLAPLVGSFLTSDREWNGEVSLRFANPSARDYVSHILCDDYTCVTTLIASAVALEQVISLLRGHRGQAFRGATAPHVLALTLRRLAIADTAPGAPPVYTAQLLSKPEARAMVLCDIADRLNHPDLVSVARHSLARVLRLWRGEGVASPEVVAPLLRRVYAAEAPNAFWHVELGTVGQSGQALRSPQLLAAGLQVAAEGLATADDLEAMADLRRALPAAFSDTYLTLLGDKVADVCHQESYAEESPPTSGFFRDHADRLERAAIALDAAPGWVPVNGPGYRVAWAVERLRDQAEGLEQREREEPPTSLRVGAGLAGSSGSAGGHVTDLADLPAMFRGLQSLLETSPPPES
ncbi:MAG: restriction endonuclease [Gemmatimonadaceae bacterium]|nr:restriction endonuclease [Gemmatimonadaceae bacterium]